MSTEAEPNSSQTPDSTHPDWVMALQGADVLYGAAKPPRFHSRPWSLHFSLPSDLSELEGAVDPLLLIYAGAGFVRDLESKMDLLVAMAREQGRSWTEIGRALGVTKQTAWARLSRVVAEGKTKIIEDAGNGEVLVRSKDDITAGDGARHDLLEGKAAASTRTTVNIFRLLERHGIPTHFVDRVDDVTFRARDVAMIPLELVARRYATGSFRDRFPDLADGAALDELVFEIFEKDDAHHDPLLEFDFEAGVVHRFVPNTKAAEAIGPDAAAGDLISSEPLAGSRYDSLSPALVARLRGMTASAFEVIEDAWRQHGGVYIDYKIECGFDRETGELLVADVIDSDSGRLRFGEVDMSKQPYRDGTATLPDIKKRFDEVADLTERFAHGTER
jgi:phosphoribosylaminoimidazole-succinocarboxamide synthase